MISPSIAKQVRPGLLAHIDRHIIPEYKRNDPAHRVDHAEYVIERSFKFAEQYKDDLGDLDPNMLYAIAAYHDVGAADTPENDAIRLSKFPGAKDNRQVHDKISAERMAGDAELRKFFSEDQISAMCVAITEHRASAAKVPETAYGDVVAAADKSNDVGMILGRAWDYSLKKSEEKGEPTDYESISDKVYGYVKSKYERGKYGGEGIRLLRSDPDAIAADEKLREILKDKLSFDETFREIAKERNPEMFAGTPESKAPVSDRSRRKLRSEVSKVSGKKGEEQAEY